jgi:putative ABC transport system substrate-binding protein
MIAAMNRRHFIGMLGVAASWPLAARAQQAVVVIGYLGSATPDLWAGRVQAFRQGLRDTGYVDGQNVAIEFRWAENHYDRLPALAADLVRRGVAAIVAPGSAPAALVAKAATTTIPIVFETGADPVAAGLVPSLSRPGGNITGVTALAFELGPKRLELLLQFVPSAKSIAVLYNPTAGDVVARQTRDLKAAASKLGVDLQIYEASADGELDEAFASMRQRSARGLVVVPDVFTNSRDAKIAALALRQGVPAIFQASAFAAAGGLLSYGGDIMESHRLAGTYAGRVLKGEKPADLPVIQAAKVAMIVNLKTAKALGIDIPLPLLGRADEVIE